MIEAMQATGGRSTAVETCLLVWRSKDPRDAMNTGDEKVMRKGIEKNENGEVLAGVAVVHVDDIEFSMTSMMVRKVIPEIKRRFAVGSEESGELTFTGVQVTQQKGLMIHQKDYANEMKEVTVPVKPKGEKLTETQVTDVRRVIGQLQWLSIQTRPDLSFSASVIASDSKHLKDKELKNVNKTVKYAKYYSSQGIPYRKIDMMDEATEMWSYSDASFANLTGGGTQAAVIVFVVESKDVFADKEGCCNQRGRATGVYGHTEEEK